MFKKPFSLGGRTKASGGDRKKLRKSLEKILNCSEDMLDQVIPLKQGELEVVKLTAPSKTTLYLLDKVPMLVDPNGKGDFVPTVFALWKAPTLVPRVLLKHPLVSQYVVNGADLMLPGVLFPPDGLEPFNAGGVVAVCSPGNPCPVAVGIATMSSREALLRKDNRGKLVELIQHYGDHLWSDVGGGTIPNEGFQGNVVMNLGGEAAAGEMPEAGMEPEGAGEDGDDEGSHGVGAEAAGTSKGLEAACAADGIASLSLSQDPATSASASASASAPVSASASASASGSQFPEDMDELLELCLLQALHKSVKDGDLPLNSSVLWNGHILPVRPQGCSLDVKKSKHKKMSKFLQVYSKLGLLKTKEDKHSGDVILTSINRSHNLYTEHRPYKTSLQTSSAGGGGAAAAAPSSGAAAAGPDAAAAAAAASTSAPANNTELHIETVYKPTKELKPVFEALGLSVDALYSGQEAGNVAFEYVRVKELEEAGNPARDTVVLDPHLCDALFKGVINTKKGELYPSHVRKADLRELFCRRMQAQFRIVRPGMAPLVKKGQVPSIQVSLEKRQGNKKVTRIVGLETFLVDPGLLGQECQKKFASSTSMADLPGKNQGAELVIQGGVADAVAEHLVRAYGIPRHLVNVTKKA